MNAISPKTVRLTVNGQDETVHVPARAQLAEILRDDLNLTATHLACEQGVCGACTVLVDGKPVRSCLTFATDCEGRRVETLEGYRDDDVMDRLRDAFSRHHALQCGFCTPGMLASARDIVLRLDTPDEKRIRNELSGNLCRCTGYMGIVAAIAEVISQRAADGLPGHGAARIARGAPRGFAASEPVFEAPEADAAPTPASGTTTVEDGWTVVRRSVTLAHPLDRVWAHFGDLEAVARCLPGAELSEHDDTTFAGHVEVRFGPISARFAGEGSYRMDAATRSGRVDGRGKDRGGQSNIEGRLDYVVAPEGADSRVDLAFRFRIEGALGQFNRPELVNGLVDYILGEFVGNCDAVMSGGEVRASRGVSVWSVLKAMFAGLFRRKG